LSCPFFCGVEQPNRSAENANRQNIVGFFILSPSNVWCDPRCHGVDRIKTRRSA
jgi:hypothetical protein